MLLDNPAGPMVNGKLILGDSNTNIFFSNLRQMMFINLTGKGSLGVVLQNTIKQISRKSWQWNLRIGLKSWTTFTAIRSDVLLLTSVPRLYKDPYCTINSGKPKLSPDHDYACGHKLKAILLLLSLDCYFGVTVSGQLIVNFSPLGPFLVWFPPTHLSSSLFSFGFNFKTIIWFAMTFYWWCSCPREIDVNRIFARMIKCPSY